MYQTGCSAYRQSAANTIEDKRVILLKLYEGAIVFNNIAKRGIRDNSPKIRGENISKVMGIISELMCALDHEKGGELSARLESLYLYIMDRLLRAGRHDDLGALDEVEQVLRVLKDGFETALKEQKNTVSETPAAIPPEMTAAAPQRPLQYAV